MQLPCLLGSANQGLLQSEETIARSIATAIHHEESSQAPFLRYPPQSGPDMQNGPDADTQA
jgi:hypothetical protein